MKKKEIERDLRKDLRESLEKEGAIKEAEEKTGSIVPTVQTCMIKTKHGKTIECKFWVHTDKYFQYYEKGYTLKHVGKEAFIIEGDTVIIPNHEIQYVIIRNAQSSIPESMFLSLGGKKKLIEVVGNVVSQK
ncbi:MAG: hypothetical protein E3J83_03385 [Candidatus Atribacteria bacterium]|nr:MAG: hypothetical protein E3J83_03385 [Candidatus Atribacteria bacterium]